MRNSSQANATWVTSKLHALLRKHSSTQNVKAKVKMAQSDFNLEAPKHWKFFLEIQELGVSVEREFSVKDETLCGRHQERRLTLTNC